MASIYKTIKTYQLKVNEKVYNVEIIALWEKFAKVPFYLGYVNDERVIARYSKIQKRDFVNYIERYL